MATKSRRWRMTVWIAAVCLLMLSACSGGGPVAFRVEGVAVEKDELVYYMRDYSSVAAAEMESTYGVNSGEDGFWEKRYGELKPLEYLKEYTVEQIARTKMEQIIAREQGIETPLTWTEQHKELEEENRRRREAYEAGEVVYGSIERDFVAYFANTIYGMRMEVQEALGLTEEEYTAMVEERLERAEIGYEDMSVSAEDVT